MPYETFSSGLTIQAPTAGTKNWAETLRTQLFAKISAHDHTGSGKGLQIATAAIANLAVTAGKLAADSVTTTKILDLNVTTAKLADGAVTTAKLASGVSLPPGMISPYGGTAAPTGWLLCDGSAVNRITYADLFAIVSTAFGIGDGVNTFNVPDLRGKFPLGKATAGTGSTLGGTGGNIDHVHTGPSHTHALTSGFAKLDYDDASNDLLLETSSRTSSLDVKLTVAGGFSASSGALATTRAIDLGGTTDAGGTGNTGTANPPFQAVNYIIKT